MTRDKDRTRIIRSRMKSTGESYTAARRQVLARAPGSTSRRPAAPGSPLPENYATLAGKSDETMKRQTGYTWPEWMRILEADGVARMTHGEIARHVNEKYGVSGWWSQSVTVGYERLKGLREPGQRLSGAYEASKSKTFDVPVATLYAACADDARRRRWLTGVDAKVRSGSAPKTLRLQWPDGTIVALWFAGKGAGKSHLALAHTKLKSKAAMEQAKAEWSARLDSLAKVLR